jgi:hypothetical protein
MNLNFLGRFSKNDQIKNFMKTRLVGTEFSMRTEGRRDRKLAVTFQNICERACKPANNRILKGQKFLSFQFAFDLCNFK